MSHPHRNADRQGGEARGRRTIERAERAHKLRRQRIVVAATAGAVLFIAVTAGALGGFNEAPVAARAAAPVTVATVTPTVAIESGAEASSTKTAVVEPKTAAVSAQKPAVAPSKAKTVATQRLSIGIGDLGYDPAIVRASADRPITLTVARGEGCAAGFLMPSLGIDKDNSSGPVTIKLGTLKPGTYRFTCGMEMVEGKLIVS